jgi:acyl carrier protein
MEKKIKQIFCKVIGIDESKVTDDTSYNDCEMWDSLNHLKMVAELEEEFKTEFDTDDIIAMETLGKIKEIVKAYVEKKCVTP